MVILFWNEEADRGYATQNRISLGVMSELLYGTSVLQLTIPQAERKGPVQMTTRRVKEDLSACERVMEHLYRQLCFYRPDRAKLRELLREQLCALCSHYTDYMAGGQFHEILSYEAKIMRYMQVFLKACSELFDYIIIDGNSGVGHIRKLLWKQADLIMCSVAYGRHLSTETISAFAGCSRKVILLRSAYDEELYGEQQYEFECYDIRTGIDFCEAIEKKKLLQYLLAYIEDEETENGDVVRSIKELAVRTRRHYDEANTYLCVPMWKSATVPGPECEPIVGLT